jgi:hypothetical protein
LSVFVKVLAVQDPDQEPALSPGIVREMRRVIAQLVASNRQLEAELMVTATRMQVARVMFASIMGWGVADGTPA